MGFGIKKVEDNELETVIVQRRSLRATRDLKAGHEVKAGDFIPLRPCPSDAISPEHSRTIIGSSLRKDVDEGDYLRERDFN